MNEEQMNTELLLDALFLALRLTGECKRAESAGRMTKGGDKLILVTKRAWERYNRRAARVPGIRPVPQ
jgi:hypothetical protein